MTLFWKNVVFPKAWKLNTALAPRCPVWSRKDLRLPKAFSDIVTYPTVTQLESCSDSKESTYVYRGWRAWADPLLSSKHTGLLYFWFPKTVRMIHLKQVKSGICWSSKMNWSHSNSWPTQTNFRCRSPLQKSLKSFKDPRSASMP